MRAATVVQHLCKSCRTCFMFYCMFYFTCDRSFTSLNCSYLGYTIWKRLLKRLNNTYNTSCRKNLLLVWKWSWLQYFLFAIPRSFGKTRCISLQSGQKNTAVEIKKISNGLRLSSPPVALRVIVVGFYCKFVRPFVNRTRDLCQKTLNEWSWLLKRRLPLTGDIGLLCYKGASSHPNEGSLYSFWNLYPDCEQYGR